MRLEMWPSASTRRESRSRHKLVASLFGALLIAASVSSQVAADPIFPTPGGQAQAPSDSSAGVGILHSVVPARVRDTRTGIGGPIGPLAPQSVAVVDVTGSGGVPTTGVSAVVANITVTEPTAPGYLTVYPNGVATPLASNLNFIAGQTVPNLVVVQVGADGNIAILNGSGGTSHLVVDITGWYEPANPSTASAGVTVLHSVVPARVRDTRTGIGGPIGPLAPHGVAVVDVTGTGGVPTTGVSAVVANITVTEPTAPGYLTVYPNGVATPLASNLNFIAGQTVPNLVVVQVGADGNIAILNGSGGTSHLVVDITGWYGAASVDQGGLLTSVVPGRVRDTRTGIGGPIGSLAPHGVAVVDVTGSGGVPTTGVSAVVANITVTEPTAPGYLTVYPNGVATPLASNLNFIAGQTVPNLVVVQVGADGNIAILNGSGGTSHLVVDITGWYSASSTSVNPTGTSAALNDAPSVEPQTTLNVNAARRTEVWHPTQPDLRGLKFTEQTTSDRIEVNTAETTAFTVGDWGYLQRAPDSAVGRIYNLDASGTIIGFCSGTVVARNLVLTAGHCGNSAGYAFAPQQFGNSFPYGVWYATRYHVASQYLGSGFVNSGADFAFLMFDNANGAGKLLGDVVGWFPIHSDPPAGLKYSEGYPSEGWFNQNCTTTAAAFGGCSPVFCASQLNSSSQYHLEATDPSVSFGGWWSQGFGCPMTGGSSGGPVFQEIDQRWYVVGVNSHVDFGPTYSDGCTRESHVCGWYSLNMWAPYLNQVVIDDWNVFAVTGG